MPQPSAQERTAELLEQIRYHSEGLLDLDYDVVALPAEAEHVLEAASRGEPTDPQALALAREVAEQLDNTLTWQWLKASTVLFTDYAGTIARMAARREARQAKAAAD
jgi:hypothetical protein